MSGVYLGASIEFCTERFS